MHACTHPHTKYTHIHTQTHIQAYTNTYPVLFWSFTVQHVPYDLSKGCENNRFSRLPHCMLVYTRFTGSDHGIATWKKPVAEDQLAAACAPGLVARSNEQSCLCSKCIRWCVPLGAFKAPAEVKDERVFQWHHWQQHAELNTEYPVCGCQH